jgi:hypothetical protein
MDAGAEGVHSTNEFSMTLGGGNASSFPRRPSGGWSDGTYGGLDILPPYRHPELVSGSIYQPKTSACVARWMLNRVQHDVWGKRVVFSPSPQRVNVSAL